MFQAVQLWHGAGACAQKRAFLALAAAQKVGKEVKAAHPVTVSACIASCTRCAAVMMYRAKLRYLLALYLPASAMATW